MYMCTYTVGTYVCVIERTAATEIEPSIISIGLHTLLPLTSRHAGVALSLTGNPSRLLLPVLVSAGIVSIGACQRDRQAGETERDTERRQKMTAT